MLSSTVDCPFDSGSPVARTVDRVGRKLFDIEVDVFVHGTIVRSAAC